MTIMLHSYIIYAMTSYYFYIPQSEPCDARMTAFRVKCGSAKRALRQLARLQAIAEEHGDYFQPRNQESEDFLFRLSEQIYGEDALSITRFLFRNVSDIELSALLSMMAKKREYRNERPSIQELCKVTLTVSVPGHYERKIADL